MLLDELDDILVHILRLRTHLVVEVRTVERALELLRLRHAEILLDVGTHLIGGRSRQSDDGRLANLVDDGTNTTVLWTEVMTPL